MHATMGERERGGWLVEEKKKKSLPAVWVWSGRREEEREREITSALAEP